MQRLGLTDTKPSDPDNLIRPLLDLMRDYKLDFHSTFRRLCFFRPSMLAAPDSEIALKAFVESLFSASFEGDKESASKEWSEWLRKLAARVSGEKVKSTDDVVAFEGKREKAMLRANPRFVLRQWVLEEIIKRVQDDVHVGKRALAKVHEVCCGVQLCIYCVAEDGCLQMATKPFHSWGAESKTSEDGLTPEEKEERRYCGMGSTKMLGFQCSCSS